jgi:hypothetical protein
MYSILEISILVTRGSSDNHFFIKTKIQKKVSSKFAEKNSKKKIIKFLLFFYFLLKKLKLFRKANSGFFQKSDDSAIINSQNRKA